MLERSQVKQIRKTAEDRWGRGWSNLSDIQKRREYAAEAALTVLAWIDGGLSPITLEQTKSCIRQIIEQEA